MGRSGRETTLCTEQKEVFKISPYFTCPNQFNAMIYAMQLEFFEEACWLVVTTNCENLAEKDPKCNNDGDNANYG